ncbi:hypothetical protein ANCCAN_06765 [Ancylostoma caninum]|uniref:SCP domain-containing protein n=1 Tax=Ancylostoma caninum TaxID=29170 RepID=A0A368GUC0_ANCCA|nr:hypothetical protein ANCCAN_06765 [Ancylostoma caninum]
MNNNLQDIALNMHNYYRRQVATGWMPDKTNGYAPRAKNMLGLVRKILYNPTEKPCRRSLLPQAYDCTTNNIGQNCKTAVDNCPTTKPTATAGYALNYYRVNKYQLTESEILAEVSQSRLPITRSLLNAFCSRRAIMLDVEFFETDFYILPRTTAHFCFVSLREIISRWLFEAQC